MRSALLSILEDSFVVGGETYKWLIATEHSLMEEIENFAAHEIIPKELVLNAFLSDIWLRIAWYGT